MIHQLLPQEQTETPVSQKVVLMRAAQMQPWRLPPVHQEEEEEEEDVCGRVRAALWAALEYGAHRAVPLSPHLLPPGVVPRLKDVVQK